MIELDPNVVTSALVSAGGIWAAIRLEIKLLWRETERLDKRVTSIEKGGN